MGISDDPRVTLEPQEVVYLEDLPDGTIIPSGAFKPQKGVPLKIAGVPVGTCDIDVDDDGNVTYTAEFKRDKISPELYDVMFERHETDGPSMAVHHNVFDSAKDEELDDHARNAGFHMAPFRHPRS